MEKKQIEGRVGPPLATVIQELAGKLIADDWARWATADGTSFYYVLGMAAFIAEVQSGVEHHALSVSGGRPISVLGEQRVHARLASTKGPDYYLRQARKRLEDSGISGSQIDRFLDSYANKDTGALASWDFGEPGSDRFNALINLMHAVAIQRGVDIGGVVTEAERAREIDNALAKVYLLELSKLFAAVTKRAGSLVELTFDDKHLNEASRCYLYGFLKATVVLSATAIERCLQEAIGQEGLDRVHERVKREKAGFYSLLVREATDRHVLGLPERMGEDPVLASYSSEIFRERNRVAHEGLEPAASQAESLLMKARQVVEFVRTRERGPKGEKG